MARAKTRVISVCSGVLFAVVGGFAALVSESANAQTVSVAVGQVYSPVGMVTVRIVASDPLTTSASVPVDDLWALIAQQPGTQIPANNWGLIDPQSGMTTAADGGDSTRGLPTFGGAVMMTGDIVRFINANSRVGGGDYEYTVRIFTDGTDLFMARGEGEAAPAVVAPVSLAAVSGEQFYIQESDWTTVGVLSTGVVGFRAVQCASGYLSDDDLTCRLPRDSQECEAENADRPIFADGETGNCREANDLSECTGSESFDSAATGAARCTATCPDARPAEERICTAPDENGGGTPTVTTTMAMTMTTASPENGAGDISDSGDGRNHAPVFVFGGLMLMGAVGYIMSGGDLDAFAFSPAFGYSVNESGYSANVGGRMDFRKDEWRLFWTAGQTNANGDFGEFRYSSGGEYRADFWQASFSESVQGETADYDFSLSADLSGGMWQFSPVYRFHSRLEEGESETRNSLNLEGVLEWNRWTIRQSAGFQWRRAEEFADNTRFRLEAVREF